MADNSPEMSKQSLEGQVVHSKVTEDPKKSTREGEPQIQKQLRGYGKQGMRSYCFMDTEFPFGKTESSGNGYQQWLFNAVNTLLNHIHKNGYSVKLYVMYILPQLNKK